MAGAKAVLEGNLLNNRKENISSGQSVPRLVEVHIPSGSMSDVL